MTTHKLEDFYPLVKNIAWSYWNKNKYKGNCQKEDCEQELYVKLIETYPVVKEFDFNNANYFLSTCLKNKAVDDAKKLTSWVKFVNNLNPEEILSGMESNVFSHKESASMYSYVLILKEIYTWSENSNNALRKQIGEYVKKESSKSNIIDDLHVREFGRLLGISRRNVDLVVASLRDRFKEYRERYA